ncbi:MAG TPA: MFS transporter [Actinophytocola sp.]|uniref:MFS transporter n=1 Tax=Actinophytocola sp. TaxID=1872138 RepID=UPI002DDDA990|nr:MFS transporter [Actinophytocola sp.]HEV2783900.1 MFS transporter [Actinophytocola sp.]
MVTVSERGEPAVPRATLRTFPARVAAGYLLQHLGHFGVLPVLAVVLVAQVPGASPAVVGTALFGYVGAVGVSCLLVSRWLSRISYVHAMVTGLLLAAAMFAVLPYVASAPLLIALLLLAGLGTSVNVLLCRAITAHLIPSSADRNRVFSAQQIAVNIAAALAPFAALTLVAGGHSRLLFGIVAAFYTAAAVIVRLVLPGRIRPAPGPGRWPVGRSTVARLLRDRDHRRVLIASAAGSGLYAQFFSAFALLISHEVSSAPLRGSYFVANAVIIVLLQVPVSAVVARLLDRGVTPASLLYAGIALFSVSMVLLGAGIPLVGAAFLAVAIFSVAETIFTPMVSTAFAELPTGSPIEAFNLRQACWTVGEAAGSFCGGSIFLVLLNHGGARLYWLSLAACGLAAVALLALPLRASVRNEA